MSQILLYAFCFFPFVKFLPLGLNLDTQPWALVWSCIFIVKKIINEKKLILPKKFLYLIAFALGNVLIVIVFDPWLPKDNLSMSTNITYTSIRNLLSVASMLIITYAVYSDCIINGFKEKYIKVIINIWLIVGLVQKYITREFLYFIVANARTSSNRGVVALASEPSFYGYMCVFMLLFVYDFKKDKLFYIINLIVQIVLLAESTNTLLFLACVVFFLVIKAISLANRKTVMKYIGIGVTGVIVCSIVFKQVILKMQGQRMVNFLNIILSKTNLSNKINVFLNDGSVAKRLWNITEPLGAFVRDYGLPHGIETVRDISGFAGYIYQYGVGGVIVIILIIILIRKGYSSKEIGKSFAYSFTAIMFIGIQMTSPIVWFFVGYCMARKNLKKI